LDNFFNKIFFLEAYRWLILIVYYIQESQKHKFSEKPHKYFANISIIIKQTFCPNLRVENAIVLVLFKILNSPISIFMSNILFCHGYTRKYVIMNDIKKLKKLIYNNNCMGNCKITKIGDIWIKSDFRLICGYFFVT
jgi:hypothetical protein